ncbi:MAG TPA: RlpA-like double-psi beta-barrel domain-containing protein [Polyangiaceae bacterium]|jgi:hypothetical protein|nr:RlpA-like double-psi beta-barrel domain-containing protein [Polyangiaceae bacterium]
MMSDSTDSGSGSSGAGSGSDGTSGSSGSTSTGSASGSSSGSTSGSTSGSAHDAGTHDSGSGSTAASDSGASGQCTWGTNHTPATFTEYYFGQGPETETACGYKAVGSETKTGGNLYDYSDTVANLANTGGAKNTYFAAMPSDTAGNWPMANCGACVVVTGQNGAKAIATLIDECPITGGSNSPCTEGNHLDLSAALFASTEIAAGKPNNGGDDPGSWHFIACPITTDIVTLFNNSYSGQIYIQNMIYPIASGTANGKAMTQSQYAYWEAAGLNDFKGVTLKLTDVLGHTITGTVSNTDGGSLGAQFPSPGNCPVQ